MPSNIEPDVNASSQLIVTNPTAQSGEVKVKWVIQRNGNCSNPVLPDNRHGSDLANGCASWTVLDGERIKENSLTDTARNSHASTEYNKSGKFTEAFQVIDLGKRQNITHIRITNSDAKWIWLMSFSGSMDGKIWTDFADMQPVDMHRKWGVQNVAVRIPQKLRYFRIRHHKNGAGVQKIAMPVTVELFNGTLDEYYEFMRPAIVVGHRADPNALMFNGGFAGIELGLINTMATYTFDDGKHPSDLLDGLSVHTYTGAIAPELSKLDTNLHRGANAISGTSHLENLMRLVDWRKTHMKGKPLWMTETGYDTGGKRAVSIRKHAAYTVRNIMMMLGAGIDNVMIYRESGDGNSLYAASGMLTSQGQPRAPFFSLATLVRQISGAGPLHKLQLKNPDIWAYAWIKDGKPAMAVWSVADQGKLDMDMDMGQLL